MATPQAALELIQYLNLKLAALGQAPGTTSAETPFLQVAQPLLRNYYQKVRLLGKYLCPADARIQSFLDDYLRDCWPAGAPRLPASTFVLDRPGLARALSLPPDSSSLPRRICDSYRVPQGVLHNPASDRRTTQGIFHIAEGGLPVPADKQAVPKAGLRGTARGSAPPARRPADAAVHRATSRRPARLLRLAAAAPAGLPGDGNASSPKTDGDPLFRAGQPGQQPRFRREHLRQRRRSVSAGKRRRARRAALDRPHRLRRSSRRTSSA